MESMNTNIIYDWMCEQMNIVIWSQVSKIWILYGREHEDASFALGFNDWLIDWFIVYNATFSYIMATSFSGGRSRNTRREPPTMGKQLVNCMTCGCESSAPFFVFHRRWNNNPWVDKPFTYNTEYEPTCFGPSMYAVRKSIKYQLYCICFLFIFNNSQQKMVWYTNVIYKSIFQPSEYVLWHDWDIWYCSTKIETLRP